MSRRGNCWDNAPQESFFGHMKSEINLNASDDHTILQQKIDDWINYYNNERCQWGLAKLSPNEYYEYIRTNIYPIPNTINNNITNGALPQTPEFNALVSRKATNRKDD